MNPQGDRTWPVLYAGRSEPSLYNEPAADRIAAECGYGDDLTALYESHPPLIRRIESIREMKRDFPELEKRNDRRMKFP